MRVVPPPCLTTILPPPENVAMPVVTAALVNSPVTFTSFDSPASSENDDGSIVTFSPGLAAAVNVNGRRNELGFVRRTVRVAVNVGSDGESRPNVSAGGSAPIIDAPAPTASMRPPPVGLTSSLTLLVEAMSAALIRAADQSRCTARRSAATPATCGVAIDVPLRGP